MAGVQSSSRADASSLTRTELGSLAEIIAALTTAIDLAEDNGTGHTLRTCIIGMRIGRRISLTPPALSDLYYALLLKDIGGSHTQLWERKATGQDGVLARRLLREGMGSMSWLEGGRAALGLYGAEPLSRRVSKQLGFLWKQKTLRSEAINLRSAVAGQLLEKLGVSTATRAAVCSIDERWDGRGGPDGMDGTCIPVIAQIVKLSQTMERFHAQGGSNCVIPWLHRRCRGWFDPGLVAAATRLFETPSCWWQLEQKDLQAYAISLEPSEHMLAANSHTIDQICEVFAEVADARSEYGFAHSFRVADIAVRMARSLQMSERQVNTLRRAALLHSIGKLTVPRELLEKQGPLTKDDLPVLRNYPLRTCEILERIPEFREVALLAMMHHERLDGSGYPKHLSAEQLSLSARILAVADVAEALAAERSFRRKYTRQQIYQILIRQTPHALDKHCVHAFFQSSAMSRVA
ncbi:HD-GYP domain-containing protein [Terriglobus roseus DSM 18391]|uniref:HD-GYP domain-containing protein n=1 Tax=Terriglobus roseus (strain DSM 18391 / NRRL B-41598 / KBS 63) TaxID=926566 RepID=I3ZLH2_TERRK|nr:HD domain-containing phosphohydrolase [Terriglobus roseus]AFL90090.1 HD-GYP domain-containing protein [Terriglobus roseus DSM 18391]